MLASAIAWRRSKTTGRGALAVLLIRGVDLVLAVHIGLGGGDLDAVLIGEGVDDLFVTFSADSALAAFTRLSIPPKFCAEMCSFADTIATSGHWRAVLR